MYSRGRKKKKTNPNLDLNTIIIMAGRCATLRRRIDADAEREGA
jgi:hypothetical protein